ncbi:MAG: DUF126 domain-containing protein [Candidatus Nezhaarchaeota archaeon]|nr:DUF126 domain-containing protein [Candidatus Nezhaarchaeota archaeon]
MSYKGKGVVAGRFRGEALVSVKPLSLLGGVDPDTGVVLEKGHDLEGKGLAGKVLVMLQGKGSTVGSYVIYSLAKKGKAPGAIATVKMDLMTITGCAISEIPLVCGIPEEALRALKCGDIVEVDAFQGVVRKLSRK